MKLHQTDQELTIKMSGVMSLIGGVIISLVGIFLTIALLNSTTKWTAVFGLVFITAGIILLYTASIRTFVFQKNGTTSITRKRLLFGSPEVQSFPTDTITHVILESHIEYRSNTQENTTNNIQKTTVEPVQVGTLAIYLADGSLINIDSASKSSGFGGGSGLNINGIPIGGMASLMRSFTGKAPLTNEAEKLSAFLGLPLTNQGATGNAPQQSFTGAQSPTPPQQSIPLSPAEQQSQSIPPSQPTTPQPVTTPQVAPLAPAPQTPQTQPINPPTNTPPSPPSTS